MKLPRFLDSKEVFRSTKFTVIEERFELPGGDIVSRSKLGHGGAAVIIPVLPDGRIVLVEQFRYALRDMLLELPAGTRDGDEDPFITAQRELKEEIGGVSERWEPLGAAYSTPGFTNELLYAYLARDVVIGETALEHGELVHSKTMTLSEVESAIRNGDLRDMKSITALSQARALGFL